MNSKKTISIVLVVILGVVIFALLIVERLKYQEQIASNGKVSDVDNYSIFFTVDECANRYVNYITNGNTNHLLKILNEDYKNNNNINEKNVIEKLDTLGINNKIVSLKTKKIYSKRVSDNVTKYYLKGIIYLDDIDDSVEYGDYYLEINIDSDTLYFDVLPYNGEVFKEKK